MTKISECNYLVVLMITLTLVACSRSGQNQESHEASRGATVTGASQHCLMQDELAQLRGGPQTNEALWKLVKYYSLCLNDEKQAEPWLRKLVARGDPEAMVQLAAWLDVVGKKEEAMTYAAKAKELGYASGASELKTLQGEK